MNLILRCMSNNYEHILDNIKQYSIFWDTFRVLVYRFLDHTLAKQQVIHSNITRT